MVLGGTIKSHQTTHSKTGRMYLNSAEPHSDTLREASGHNYLHIEAGHERASVRHGQ